MRNIFAAREKAHHRATLERAMVADRAAEHRIFFLQSVEQRFHCRGSVKIDMHFIADLCERAEVMGKNDANHWQKSQIPKPKLQRNPKFQAPTAKSHAAVFGSWSLELLWDLVLGIWNLFTAVSEPRLTGQQANLEQSLPNCRPNRQRHKLVRRSCRSKCRRGRVDRRSSRRAARLRNKPFAADRW